MPAYSSPRAVISWFGWDVRDFVLIADETLSSWKDRVEGLVAVRGWAIERFGNPIDIILGHPFRSITSYEFYDFQRDWEKLNAEFGLRFSAVLWLLTEGQPASPNGPMESYIVGQKSGGDSIGKPIRHRPRQVSPNT